jgi:signal transduction histidine kinase/DNA-binding response OmpR family regulator
MSKSNHFEDIVTIFWNRTRLSMKTTGFFLSIFLILHIVYCTKPAEARLLTDELIDREPFTLSQADTNAFGNFHVQHFEGWQFAYQAPHEIRDGINLANTVPVQLHDFHQVMQDERWTGYGWLEITLDVTADVAGRPYILSYRNHPPVRIWLNGHLMLENGTPSTDPDQEVLSRFINSVQTGIIFREGLNYLLIEHSWHTVPVHFNFFGGPDHGLTMSLFRNSETFQRRHRAFMFGGAFMLLGLLVIIHAYLAVRFRNNYHIFVSLTTLSLMVLAITTLSDTLIDWTYAYLYFHEFAYVISVACVGYFYAISVRLTFGLTVPCRVLHLLLGLFTLAGILSIYLNRDWLNIVHPLLVLLCLGYVIYSLGKARRLDPNARIGVVAGGLIIMALGTALYTIVYVAFNINNHILFITSILLTFTGIPVSLTFNVTRQYADLIDTLEAKVEARTADLALANSYQKRFFANISHEFRTPLTISEGLVNKLIRQPDQDPSKAQYDLSVVKRNMGRLNDMVNQIIDLTKSEQQHLTLRRDYYKADELASISVESFRSLAEHHGHTFRFRPDARDTILHADRAKVEVMINNLISNAIKYTPDGGFITIATRTLGTTFELTVEDSGPGIPAGQEEAIFERFHRLKRAEEDYVEGMGVGLELSRTLANLHGGTIVADPDVETGALFRLELPVANPAQMHQPVIILEEVEEASLYSDHTVEEDAESNRYQILLVEDNEDMMHYVAGVLSGLGTVELARNGREALNRLAGFTPDIIITDLMMPVMGGEKLVETLMGSKKWANIPVVVLTAKALEEDKLHLLRIGVVDYIIKPFSPEHLLLKTRNLLSYYNRRKRLKVDVAVEETPFESERLSDKTAAYIMKNLSDVTLSVDSIADAFSQSRSSFYRNIQLETGMSPAEFIREVRLMAARNMVAKNKIIRLDELANAVGYKSAHSFRRKYMDRFGEHPLGE